MTELVRGRLAAGTHRVRFDAKGLTSGVSFGRLLAGDTEVKLKTMLVK